MSLSSSNKKRKIVKTTAEESAFLIYYDKIGNEIKTPLKDIIDILQKNPIEQKSEFKSKGLLLKQKGEFNAETFKRYMDKCEIDKLKKIFLKTDNNGYREAKSARKEFVEFLQNYFKDAGNPNCLVELLKMKNGPTLINEMIENDFFAFNTLSTEITILYAEIMDNTDIFSKSGKRNNFDIIAKIFERNAIYMTGISSSFDMCHSSREGILKLHCRRYDLVKVFRPFAEISDDSLADRALSVNKNMLKTFETLKQLEILGKGDLYNILLNYTENIALRREVGSLLLCLLDGFFNALLDGIVSMPNHPRFTKTPIVIIGKIIVDLIENFPRLALYNILLFHSDRRQFFPTLPITLYKSPKQREDLAKKCDLDLELSRPSVYRSVVVPPLLPSPLSTLDKTIIEIEKFEQYAKNSDILADKSSDYSYIPGNISKVLRSNLNKESSWSVKKLLFLQRLKNGNQGLFDVLPLDIFKYIIVKYLNEAIDQEFFNRPLFFTNFK
jgi:hypothetical protein